MLHNVFVNFLNLTINYEQFIWMCIVRIYYENIFRIKWHETNNQVTPRVYQLKT